MELNKKVIIRADRAGVFYGTIVRKDGNEVELKDCRRLWYWNGAASLSELALSGVKRNGAQNEAARIRKATVSRSETIRKERWRIAHGLPQLTKLRLKIATK